MKILYIIKIILSVIVIFLNLCVIAETARLLKEENAYDAETED